MKKETVGAVTHTHTHTQVSNNNEKINRKNDNGVTLIALVITIIILLILASVSITTLFGQDGIITRAQEAARKTKEASENEQAFLDYARDYIADYLHGAGEKTLEEKMADAGITGDPASLSDVVDGVPIPEGFTVSTVEGEKTKAGGLVIIDDNGSEFVWVPVKDLEPDGTRDGTFTDNQQFGRRIFCGWDLEPEYFLAVLEQFGGTTPEESKFTENIDTAVITSVEEYGGFYIARYEASYKEGKVVSKPSTTATYDTWVATNGRLWNDISQVDAKTACENMYTSDAKVVGHLPYGAEWDSTLQWFKETKFSGEIDPYALVGDDSSSWGNYGGTTFTYGEDLIKAVNEYTLINTGVETIPSNRHRVNNIYDIAGNLSEWTQTKYGIDDSRCVRGGEYLEMKYGSALSYNSIPETQSYGSMGFRPALYIK